ncbi:MAG: N-formylglutamate amidohydrolase [Bauldia sp.]|nr:N-formylglutamate amidohydrolase [Bauldia sp.]
MGALLLPNELPAVEIREGRGPFVVVCEHASNRLPRALGTLGLSRAELERHIAWDPGAAAVAAGIAERLGGDLVVQRYSRLAIDCNREPGLADAVSTHSEDTPIPGNAGLSGEARSDRVAALWEPFHAAIDRLLDARKQARRATVLVTIHTFTPVYRGVARPWHVGIISTDDRRVAEPMLASLRGDKRLVVGDNEPYSAKDNVDYTIRRHGRDRGLPHVMIEIRNDLVADEEGQREWIARLARELGALGAAARAA